MIILEGLDGVGKTTIGKYLSKYNYNIYYFPFDEKSNDIEEKYLRLLKSDTSKMILDRSFISELVYGPILRKKCRLNKEKLENILRRYKEVKPIVIYMKANKKDLLERRKNDDKDFSILSNKFEKLNNRYDKVMRVIGQYLDVVEINTSDKSLQEVISIVEEKIDENNICR